MTEPVPGVVISATRLTMVGGEKGGPGCERKYFGSYPLDIKQAETEALRRGSALHLLAELFQADGEVEIPESEVGEIFRSGAHKLDECGKLLVEWEHSGQFPDGTEWIAYLDGHSPHGGDTYCVVVQDIKTTSRAEYALNEDKGSDNYLAKNIQAMFYAWIIMCCPHWYAPPLPDGHFGPKHWRRWEPEQQRARAVRLRWIYFLTSGKPRAWEVTVFVYPEQAAAFYTSVLRPAIDTILNIHRWHLANPGARLDEFDRNSGACKGRQIWCGPGERGMCNLDQLGTPIADLVQLRVRPKLSAKERLAAIKKPGAPPATTDTKEPTPMSDPKADAAARLEALKAKRKTAPAPAPAAPPPQEEPAASPPVETTAPESTPSIPDAQPEPATTPADAAPAPDAPAAQPKPRGRPKRPPVNPGTGAPAGINPPESAAALAALTPSLQEPAPCGPGRGLLDISTEELLAEVIRRVMGASK